MKRILFLILAAGVLLAATAGAEVRGHQEPGVTYTGLKTDTKPSTAKPGETFRETDTGLFYQYTGAAWVLKRARSISITDTLTAPGNFKAVSTAGYTHATFLFSDSLVATSATVQYRGKTANAAPHDWYNLDAESDSTVFTGANGTWARSYQFAAGTDSLRGKVLSEAGGTGGKFWMTIILWNPFQ